MTRHFIDQTTPSGPQAPSLGGVVLARMKAAKKKTQSNLDARLATHGIAPVPPASPPKPGVARATPPSPALSPATAAGLERFRRSTVRGEVDSVPPVRYATPADRARLTARDDSNAIGTALDHVAKTQERTGQNLAAAARARQLDAQSRSRIDRTRLPLKSQQDFGTDAQVPITRENQNDVYISRRNPGRNDYSQYLPDRLKPGYQAPAQPVSGEVVDGATDALQKADTDRDAELGITHPAQRQAQYDATHPEVKARLQQEHDFSLAREARLRDIRDQVQGGRLAEALMGRGRGIQERAAASRVRKDDRRLTRGLGPQDRTGAILANRDRQAEERAVVEGPARAARALEDKRDYESRQGDAERRSRERIAEISAGGRNEAAGAKAERQTHMDTASGFDGLLKELGGWTKDDKGRPVEHLQKLHRAALRGQQAIRAGTPFFDGQGDIREWADQQGLEYGDSVVGIDENGYPYVGKLSPDNDGAAQINL